MNDYSQSGEQEHVLQWADRRSGPGRWLDIGAADGLTASNTRAVAERGWPGVAVEAGASQFDRLVTLYADRPDIELVQAAITVSADGLIDFHYSRDLVSTTEKTNADTWAELADFRRCVVAAASVKRLLWVLPGPYDLVSIDTEGTSIEIFDALRNLDVFAPGALVVVEAENGQERFEIQQACLDGWARVAATPNNMILERL